MAFEASCIVEIMGHQVIAGKVSEETHFGSPLMRVDVPKSSKREGFTVYYGGGAIYKITPTTEEIVKAFVEKQDPEPVKPYMLALPSFVDKVEVGDRYLDADSGYADDDDETDDVVDDKELTDKERAIRHAQDLMKRKFRVIDTETTGFTSNDEIIQIGVIDEAGATVFSSYVKPTKSITNTQYHGITDETVKDAPTFPEIYDRLSAALTGHLWVIYNAEYDSRMLSQVCRQHDLPVLGAAQIECVMLAYADYYGEWDSYRGSYKWQKLNQAVARFGLKYDGNEHDALVDCKATLDVLKKMAEVVEEKPAQ